MTGIYISKMEFELGLVSNIYLDKPIKIRTKTIKRIKCFNINSQFAINYFLLLS